MIGDITAEATRVSYAGARVHRSRPEFVRTLCRAKRVLHVGCVDAGYYALHLAARRFLHDDIIDAAKAVVGIDVDAEGVRRMLKDGYSMVAVADITVAAGRSEVMNLIRSMGGLDEIICGEVIEHVPNPLELVRGLLYLSKQTSAEIVITTPNPFYWGRFVNAAVRREIVHPDHNAYLSATNITTLAQKAGGATDVRCDFYENPSSTRVGSLVKHGLSAMFPCLADGLIVRLKSVRG